MKFNNLLHIKKYITHAHCAVRTVVMTQLFHLGHRQLFSIKYQQITVAAALAQ